MHAHLQWLYDDLEPLETGRCVLLLENSAHGVWETDFMDCGKRHVTTTHPLMLTHTHTHTPRKSIAISTSCPLSLINVMSHREKERERDQCNCSCANLPVLCQQLNSVMVLNCLRLDMCSAQRLLDKHELQFYN